MDFAERKKDRKETWTAMQLTMNFKEHDHPSNFTFRHLFGGIEIYFD